MLLLAWKLLIINEDSYSLKIALELHEKSKK